MAILPRPTPTRGVSEIRPALRFKSNDSLLRHFKDTSTLYLEIVDYPGEWLLDLPMLAQDYLSWSRQMTGLLNGQRGEWSAKWRMMCEGLDPLAPADENRLADIAAARPSISITANSRGCTLFSTGALSCREIWQEHPRCNSSRGRMSMPGRVQTGAGR